MEGKLEIKNIKDLEKILDEFIPNVRNKIIKDALRKSAKTILDLAKNNFKSFKKNKSRTNYKEFNKSFKVKFKKDGMGVVLGSDYYKSLWLEKGTVQRYTRKKNSYRGIIEGTKFFESAINSKQNEVQNNITQSVIESLNRVVKKYEK
jgi:hypothetical protein